MVNQMNNPSQLINMLQSIKANPMQMLAQMKFNVPASMANDPQAILNHLLQTNQVSQQQFNAAYQQMAQFRR